VLLKLRNDTNSPRILYFGHRVNAVEGNYSHIEKQLSKISLLRIIDNDRYYAIYQFNVSVSPFALIPSNETNQKITQIVDLSKSQAKPINFSYTFNKFHILIGANNFNQSLIVYSPYSFDKEWWSFKISGCNNFKIDASESGTIIYLNGFYSHVISVDIELKFVHLLTRIVLYLISLVVLIYVTLRRNPI
jgi:hypothetical protein